MAGTILITGGNGSVAIPAVNHLLKTYPEYTTLLTVRNPSEETDPNTRGLLDTISQTKGAKTSIRQLDLSDLSAVHAFANTVISDIASGELPPLAGIVLNAYYWNMVEDPQPTVDGYDTAFQVTHIAHAALVLRLLGHFRPDGGRVVVLSTPIDRLGDRLGAKYRPVIPEDLELLVKPTVAAGDDVYRRGNSIYIRAKLAAVMWMHALNRYLEKDPTLHNITAIATDLCIISDSRALRWNTTLQMQLFSKLVLRPFQPLLSLLDPTIRTSEISGIDVIEFATNKASTGERGYFCLAKRDPGPERSLDQEVQERLWVKSLEWAGVTGENSALEGV
ncbi:hypothetical protein FQN52_003020 [Onygenales sp. PD_12]|nr:hypothetical protein FQN52_003020 [Onygenales sp. PD_12]